MIRRRLPPVRDIRTVRLPHVVGQARLVAVPALERCCIEDTFSGDGLVWLGDHKPEIGGPWECYGLAQPYEGGSYTTRWPDAGEGLAGHGWGEGPTWSHARVDCASDVRVRGRFQMTDYEESGEIRSGVLMRWSGPIETELEAAVEVYVNRASSGMVGVWLSGGTTPDVGELTLLGYVPYVASGYHIIELDVTLVGHLLTWAARNLTTGDEATIARRNATVKTDYDGHTGVGFRMRGVSYWLSYCDYFRACPL